MDNDKYCEYWFTGYSFGLSALFADSSVSAGYVHGVKNPNDYAGLFFGTNVNAVVDGKGVAIAPNGVTAEILTIYGNLGFSSGASITGYSACSEQWIYGAAPIKWYNAWQSNFGLNQDTYL